MVEILRAMNDLSFLQLNQEFNQVFFYRWNDKKCANANNANLVNHLDSLLIPIHMEKIKILSHSCWRNSSLYSLDLIEQQIANKNHDLKIEIHFIGVATSPLLQDWDVSLRQILKMTTRWIFIIENHPRH